MHDAQRDSEESVAPYRALAAVYDRVMAHVDYEKWAGHLHDLIQRYAPGARDVLELACGTCSMAMALLRIHPYRYRGRDSSGSMITVARRKLAKAGLNADVSVGTFEECEREAPSDAVLLVYDGVNYLLDTNSVALLFDRVFSVLRPGGVFVCDQSTTANSVNNQDLFEDTGVSGNDSYVRRSWYEADLARHHTTFDLVVDGARFHEHHVQRAYSLKEFSEVVSASRFRLEACLEDLSDRPASDRSERIHWVLRRPIETRSDL